MGDGMLCIKEFEEGKYQLLIEFLQVCLPESGRKLELEGRHKVYKDVESNFCAFWCLYDDEKIVGTVALKALNSTKCELKSLYLLKKYQGKKYGYTLLMRAINYAKEEGYKEIYLDTISTSRKAICLYERVGFVATKRYNQNEHADVFMMLGL